MNHNLRTLVLFEWYTNVAKPRLWRSLLLTLLALLIASLCSMVSTSISMVNTRDTGMAGYVDESGKIRPIAESVESLTMLVRYPDMQAARQGMEKGKVAAVYRIPTGFPDDMNIQVYYPAGRPPSETMHSTFKAWLRLVLKGMWDEQAARKERQSLTITHQVIIDDHNHLVVERPSAAASLKTQSITDFLEKLYREHPAAVLLLGLRVVLGGHAALFLHSAVHREFDNSMIEILYTSVSPPTLLLGKALGVLASAWTVAIWYWPFAFWIIWKDARHIGYALALLAVIFLQMLASQTLRIYLPMYFDLRTFSIRSIQDILHVSTITLYVLLLFAWNKRHGSIAVLLTLLPNTAVPTILIRSLSTQVPWWQMGIPALYFLGSTLLILLVSNFTRRLPA